MIMKSKYFIFNYDEIKGYFFYIPISKLVWFTSILPSVGFIFCIGWSLLYDFESTTYTHCKVWNFLPSVSAAIGNGTMQYITWCITVTLHAPARFLYSINLYFSRFLQEIHEKCFIIFVVSSQLYMLLTCLALKFARKNNTLDKSEVYSTHIKLRLLIINFLSFIIAGYFFVRHNNYCEPGIYSFFALFEYIIVSSNIAFHSTAVLDFKDECITLNKQGIDVR
ncbi:hypothetical protein PGB90_006187 [Kerria lacca]